MRRSSSKGRARERFDSMLHCAEYAIALQERFGFPLYAVRGDDDYEHRIIHIFVSGDGGRTGIDVSGERAVSQIVSDCTEVARASVELFEREDLGNEMIAIDEAVLDEARGIVRSEWP